MFWQPSMGWRNVKLEELQKKDSKSVWACLSCAIWRGEVRPLNDAPRICEAGNQACDHIICEKHFKTLAKTKDTIWRKESLVWFFTKLGLQEWATKSASLDGSEEQSRCLFSEYTRTVGGHGQYALEMLTYQAPSPRNERCIPSSVQRLISSSAFATRCVDSSVVTRLLCCWDDPTCEVRCTRTSCPFVHPSRLQVSARLAADLYKLVPCCFAGSTLLGQEDGHKKACKWHQSTFCNYSRWTVPKFTLIQGKASEEDLAREAEILQAAPANSRELFPILSDGEWIFHDRLQELIRKATQDYLYRGLGMDDGCA